MKDSIWLMLLLQAVLIALNAVFASAEIAFISLNARKLEQMAEGGNKRAVRLERLTQQPAKFLATIQVAITLSGFLGSAFAADNFSDGLVDWLVSLGVTLPAKTLDTIAVILITLLLSYFTLVLGELVPKRVAMRKAESLALGMSTMIYFISKAFAPLVGLLTASTNAVLRLLGIDPDADEEEVSEEDIRMMVDMGHEKGTIDRDEKQFIQNVFAFDDLTAGQLATHRMGVDLLLLQQTDEEWRRQIYASGHASYPVCDGTADRVVGVLSAKDYLRLDSKDRRTVLERAVRPAAFVPKSVPADALLRRMRQEGQSFAVVLDEYGGMLGVVTMNDLVDRLVEGI